MPRPSAPEPVPAQQGTLAQKGTVPLRFMPQEGAVPFRFSPEPPPVNDKGTVPFRFSPEPPPRAAGDEREPDVCRPYLADAGGDGEPKGNRPLTSHEPGGRTGTAPFRPTGEVEQRRSPRGSNPGGTVPAFANCHSHAFHRALRGRFSGGADFWTWRDGMYAVAGVLDPDLYHRLARATYAEMRLAGYASVGEFHYVHHDPEGRPYAEPNVVAEGLVEAARSVGLRICLLEAHYARAGFDGEPLHPVQRRFVDPLQRWQQRVAELAARHAGDDRVVIGAAIHSVRAVPEDDLAAVAATLPDAPLHVHVSEQPAENAACLAATGRTPVRLLADAGVWGPRTTAVHATHLDAEDLAVLGRAGGFACFCPTTEAELADGIGPSVALREAGVRITLGSDSNTVIDGFAEARGLAMHERLRSGRRDGWDAAALWRAAAGDGHASLGFIVSDRLGLAESVQTAGGSEPLWTAGVADVLPPPDLDPGEVAAELSAVVDEVWSRL